MLLCMYERMRAAASTVFLFLQPPTPTLTIPDKCSLSLKTNSLEGTEKEFSQPSKKAGATDGEKKETKKKICYLDAQQQSHHQARQKQISKLAKTNSRQSLNEVSSMEEMVGYTSYTAEEPTKGHNQC